MGEVPFLQLLRFTCLRQTEQRKVPRLLLIISAFTVTEVMSTVTLNCRRGRLTAARALSCHVFPDDFIYTSDILDRITDSSQDFCRPHMKYLIRSSWYVVRYVSQM
jgi:hypothetical protein